MNGGDVIFKFKGDTSQIKKDTSKLSNDLLSAGKIAGKAFMGFATVAGTALVGITKKSVEMHGEVEQQIGGTEAVFKQFAKTVQSDASAAFDKMGLSANDYMANINKMGALMQGSGIGIKRSMELSSQAMQRAADVASVMGISVDDAMKAISGAAKGNFTMMDNLGVAMNATSLQAFALSKGIKKSYKDMEQSEKIELAMQMFLEKSAYAAGNYAKENETLAGSLNTLRASATNLLSGTGTVDQLMNSLKNFATVLVNNIVKLLPEVVNGIIKLVEALLPMIPGIIQQIFPGLLNGVVELTLKLIELLPQIVSMLSDQIPVIIPQLVDAIMIIIPELIKNYPLFVKAGLKLVVGIVKGIILGVAQLVKSIYDLAKSGIDALKEKFEGKSIWEIGEELVKGLWNGIKNVKQWIIDKIKDFGSSIVDGIKDIFGISSPSKEFEIIGKYNVEGLEKGMEKESLKLQDSFDSMFSLSPNLYGSASTNLSPNINVVNNINMKQDSLGQMVHDIKTFSGGAKNSYNYGMGA